MTSRASKAVKDANASRVHAAIKFATDAHDGQYRPGTEIPYITHPLSALRTIVQYDVSEEIRIAVVLHDVIEDTQFTSTDIEKAFGARVAHLVLAATDDKSIKKWRERKETKLSEMRDYATLDELIVICADKLDNVRSLGDNIRRAQDEGIDFWRDQFRKHTEEEYRWYYSELAKIFLAKRMGIVTTRLFNEFALKVNEVFGTDLPIYTQE